MKMMLTILFLFTVTTADQDGSMSSVALPSTLGDAATTPPSLAWVRDLKNATREVGESLKLRYCFRYNQKYK